MPSVFDPTSRVPAIEAAEIQVRRSVRQASGLDRMGVVDQKQEHVAVAGIERRGVLGDVHERVVGHRRPVQHARHFPPCVAGAVARDVHHGGDKLVIPDAAIFRAGDGAKLDATVIGFQRFHQFGAVGEQAMLQIDPGQRRGKLPHIGGWRADKAAQLPKTPMCRCHRFVTSRHQQSQPLGIVAGSLDPDGAAFHGAGLRALGAAAYRIIKIGQAEIALVIGAGKPFRRDAANTLAARHVHAKAAGNRPLVLGQGHHGHGSFSLCSWVKAQRCAATLPVGETGGARCKGGRDGGGSPGLHKPRT